MITFFSKKKIFTSRHPFNFKISTNERSGSKDDDWCVEKAKKESPRRDLNPQPSD